MQISLSGLGKPLRPLYGCAPLRLGSVLICSRRRFALAIYLLLMLVLEIRLGIVLGIVLFAAGVVAVSWFVNLEPRDRWFTLFASVFVFAFATWLVWQRSNP